MKLLTDNLVKCEYLDKSKVKTNYSGYVVYDENVADAVKRFQKDMGLTEDGIAGTTTITKLTAYAENFKKFGDRVLSVGMSGTDVTEMKNLLIEKGQSRRLDTLDVLSYHRNRQKESPARTFHKIAENTGEKEGLP